MRILVVTLNPPTGMPLGRLLESLGHSVTTTRSTSEAVAQYLKAPFSLLVVELGRDHHGGLELCRQIRAMDVAGYVHILVAASPEQASQCSLGWVESVDDFLTTPVGVECLQEHLSIAVAFISIYQNLDVLHGAVPLCGTCKRIERTTGIWQALDSVPSGRRFERFSRTICPACHAAVRMAREADPTLPIQPQTSAPMRPVG